MFAVSIALVTGSSHMNPTIWQLLLPEIATVTAYKLLLHFWDKWGELRQRKNILQIRTLAYHCSSLGNFNPSDLKKVQFARCGVFLIWKSWRRASVWRRTAFSWSWSKSSLSYCLVSERSNAKGMNSFGPQLPISLTLCCAMSLILFSIVFLILRFFII